MRKIYVDDEMAAALPLSSEQFGELRADDLVRLRDQLLKGLPSFEGSKLVERRELLVPGPADAPQLKLRIHTPVGVDHPSPCLYWVHGGGYVLGTARMDDFRFESWSPTLGCIGVSVEYRLAPEAHYPHPLEDCYAGLRWVFDHAGELGVDPMRIGIGGASAGGGLAAGLGLLARDRGEVLPRFQLLIAAMLDDRRITPSSQWTVPIWTPSQNAFGWQCYLGPLTGSEDVPTYAAAARETRLDGLPPTRICVGSADGFCDEDVLYGMRLYQAGVPTTLAVYPGGPHGFDIFWPEAPMSQRFHRDNEEWLRAAMDRV